MYAAGEPMLISLAVVNAAEKAGQDWHKALDNLLARQPMLFLEGLIEHRRNERGPPDITAMKRLRFLLEMFIAQQRDANEKPNRAYVSRLAELDREISNANSDKNESQ